ncbi:hypothetical protein BY457_11023 [Marinilabilia salmonicolor]|jgi:hypothetical protein|uniref:hypothetical protein n=1 Tax=Marinilabilia salmonicolor TaxID=989 RepID=UPI000D04FD2A|nr:hypothetical protein [Marinilabilia salmonicolor]PRY98211.1 hypothetical protein BY457_11023 [Marinilabilia salmonicolor]
MEKNRDHTKIAYRIIKIHTTEFFFKDVTETNIDELLKDSSSLAININNTVNVDAANSVIAIDVSSRLLKKEDDTVLISHTGRTVFDIKNLSEVFDEEKQSYEIPIGLLTQLHSLAYSHARALAATEVSPTAYKDKFFLPVVDPSKFIQKKQEGKGI